MRKLIFMKEDLIDAVCDIISEMDDIQLSDTVSKVFNVKCEIDDKLQFNITCDDNNELTDYVDV